MDSKMFEGIQGSTMSQRTQTSSQMLIGQDGQDLHFGSTAANFNDSEVVLRGKNLSKGSLKKTALCQVLSILGTASGVILQLQNVCKSDPHILQHSYISNTR